MKVYLDLCGSSQVTSCHNVTVTMNDVVTFFWDFGGHPTRHVLGSAHKRPLGRLPSARSRHIESMAQNFNIFNPSQKYESPVLYLAFIRFIIPGNEWTWYLKYAQISHHFKFRFCDFDMHEEDPQEHIEYTAYGTWNTQEPAEISSGSFNWKLQGRSCTAVFSSLANHLGFWSPKRAYFPSRNKSFDKNHLGHPEYLLEQYPYAALHEQWLFSNVSQAR